MYEGITAEMILQRMLNRVPGTVDKREGSLIWDALAPAADELMLIYFELNNIINESFADTASREYLIRRAAERGIKPKPATRAVLKGEFTPGIDLSGRRFSMPNTNTSYTAGAKVSDGVYYLECDSPGVEGNKYLGTIIPIDYINGLDKAELTDVLIYGADEQDTESLRQEYFGSVNTQAYGGNQSDYLEKTKAIEGVGAVKVTPLWQGGGTVKLTILDSQYNKASELLIDKAQEIIDPTKDGTGIGIAPIGHIVTVDTVTEKAVFVTLSAALADGYTWAAVEQQAVDTVKDYLYELRSGWAKGGIIVRVTQIEARLLAIQGILDLTNTRINGVAENLTLGTYEIPIYGGVSA